MRVTTRFRGLGLQLAATALVLALPAPPIAAAADPSARTPSSTSTPAERQARGEAAARSFMMGKYDEALATYMDLYIQSDGRPEYLRNVGRCQQKLHQYAAAIDSFKEYLRRAKKLTPDEKKEVQGFISEMQTAQASESSTAKSPAPAPAASAPPATTPPGASAAPAPSPSPSPYTPAPPASGAATPPPSGPAYGPSPTTAPGAPPGPSGGTSVAMGGVPPAPNPYASGTSPPPDMITRSPGGEAKTGSSPLKPIGIVGLAAGGAAAIGGAIMLLRAKSLYNQGVDMGCKAGTGAPLACNEKASSVSSANTISKILFVTGGVLGAAGVVMIAIAPSPTPEGRMGVALSGRF